MSSPRITLLTDFGTRDGYVAAMKGVIARICPSAVVDDASHDIAHGDIVAAAYAVRRYFSVYPEHTIHVVVVDPEVGSARRAIAARTRGRVVVGPDNGVFSHVLDAHAQIIELHTPQDASNTFHGRDLFAPAAAQIAKGLPWAMLGTATTEFVTLEFPQPTESGGVVVYIDRFGNLITNIDSPGTRIRIGDRVLDVKQTYADVAPGEVVALINSDHVLEIAVRNGSAADTLHFSRGTRVLVEPD